MRRYTELIETKLSYLHSILGTGYATIPAVAKLLHVDPATLRSDPTLPVIYAGSRRRVPIDSLARWLADKEVGK